MYEIFTLFALIYLFILIITRFFFILRIAFYCILHIENKKYDKKANIYFQENITNELFPEVEGSLTGFLYKNKQ